MYSFIFFKIFPTYSLIWVHSPKKFTEKFYPIRLFGPTRFIGTWGPESIQTFETLRPVSKTKLVPVLQILVFFILFEIFFWSFQASTFIEFQTSSAKINDFFAHHDFKRFIFVLSFWRISRCSKQSAKFLCFDFKTNQSKPIWQITTVTWRRFLNILV